MSEIQSICCPVCLQPFDVKEHLPKISPICGHTICKGCLIQVLKMETPKCPLDKLKFGEDFQNIDAFPTNFLGKELLEMKGKWSQCDFHKKENEMICLTDQVFVCANCVIFGDHKGHDVKLLSEFEDIAKQKKNKLLALSENISKIPSEFAKTFEEKMQSMKSIITDKFQNLRLRIAREELEVLFKFETMFMDQRINLSNLVNGTSFDMPIDLEAKLNEFNDALAVLTNPKILKLAEEDFSDLEKSFDQKLAPLKTKHTEEISRLLAVFQNTLPKEDLLKDFNIRDPLNQEILEFQNKKSFQQKHQEPQISDLIIPPVELDISHKPGTNILDIEDPITKKSFTLEKSYIEHITQLHCKLKLKDEVIERSTVSALIQLPRHLLNLESIHLEVGFCGTTNYEVAFYALILTLFSQPEKLKDIKIYASSAVLGEIGPLCLFENILPQIKDLKSFDCTFFKTQITNTVLRAINKVGFADMPNLEKFRLNIPGATFEEKDMIQLLVTIPNVKDVLLGFGDTALTDQVFEFFSTKTLPSLDKVERLEIGLWKTKLTESGVSRFLANLPDIPSLLIGFQSLQISDSCIQTFLDKMFTSLKNMQEFRLFLSDTNVSQNLIDKIQSWKTRTSQ